MKECRRCEQSKNESDFTKDLSREDGLALWCRGCLKQYRLDLAGPKPADWKKKTADKKIYGREYYKKNIEKFKRPAEYWRADYEKTMRRLHGEDWKPRVPMTKDEARKKRNKQGIEWRKKKRKVDPVLDLKIRSRKRVNRAIKDGRLIRQPCSVCGVEPAHGHHPDYSKPLEVVWLCPVHHREAHEKPYGCE